MQVEFLLNIALELLFPCSSAYTRTFHDTAVVLLYVDVTLLILNTINIAQCLWRMYTAMPHVIPRTGGVRRILMRAGDALATFIIMIHVFHFTRGVLYGTSLMTCGWLHFVVETVVFAVSCMFFVFMNMGAQELGWSNTGAAIAEMVRNTAILESIMLAVYWLTSTVLVYASWS